MTIAIVDSGFAYALIDTYDKYHEKAWELLKQPWWDFRVPAEVLVEVFHTKIQRYMQSRSYATETFAENLLLLIEKTPFQFEPLTPSDYHLISRLLHQYADSGIDYVDAVVVALAERFGTRHIMTVDERDFRTYVPSFAPHFVLPLFDDV